MSHTPPQPWTGRIDGDGPEHARWHSTIQPLQLDGAGQDAVAADATEPGTVLLGFASDEGVRRNQGRVGAAEGPQKLREMLASMAIHSTTGKPNHPRYDAGDINVTDGDLEGGQAAFGQHVAALLNAGHFTVGLGGGHEIAYASYLLSLIHI